MGFFKVIAATAMFPTDRLLGGVGGAAQAVPDAGSGPESPFWVQETIFDVVFLQAQLLKTSGFSVDLIGVIIDKTSKALLCADVEQISDFMDKRMEIVQAIIDLQKVSEPTLLRILNEESAFDWLYCMSVEMLLNTLKTTYALSNEAFENKHITKDTFYLRGVVGKAESHELFDALYKNNLLSEAVPPALSRVCPTYDDAGCLLFADEKTCETIKTYKVSLSKMLDARTIAIPKKRFWEVASEFDRVDDLMANTWKSLMDRSESDDTVILSSDKVTAMVTELKEANANEACFERLSLAVRFCQEQDLREKPILFPNEVCSEPDFSAYRDILLHANIIDEKNRLCAGALDKEWRGFPAKFRAKEADIRDFLQQEGPLGEVAFLEGHALSLYAINKFLTHCEKKDRPSWESLLAILGQLKSVAGNNYVYRHLKSVDLKEWPHELKTILQIQKLAQFEDDTFLRRTIVYLNKVRDKFGDLCEQQLLQVLARKSPEPSDKTDFLEPVVMVLQAICDEKYHVSASFFDVLHSESPECWESALVSHLMPEPSQTQDRSLAELVETIKTDPFNQGVAITDDAIDCVGSEVLQIKQCLQSKHKNKTKEQVQAYVAEHKTAFQACLSVPYDQMTDKSVFYDLVAVMMQGVKCVAGHCPRDAQMLSVLLSLQGDKGRLLEVSTGEGKTLIVAMLAILKAMSGKTVDIVTSSTVLAQRDAEKNAPLYAVFGFESAHNCSGDESALIQSYTKPILYGEVGSFQRDFLMDKFYDKNIRGTRDFASVIVDEVDSMLLDKSQNMLYLSQCIPSLQHLEPLYVYIWCGVNAPDCCNGSEESIQTVKSYIEGLIKNGTISIPKALVDGEDNFITYRLETWIKSAYVASQLLASNDFYVMDKTDDNEHVLIMDKETGVELESTHWSDGVHQFLQFKHLKNFKAESLKSVFMSNANFFKKYPNDSLYGLSGTLGSYQEKELLADIYGVDILHMPTFRAKRYTQVDPIVCRLSDALCASCHDDKQLMSELRDEWLTATANAAIEASKTRAVLIINDNIEIANAVEAKCLELQAKRKVISYKRSSESLGTDVQAGTIYISTNLAGRGTDIDVPDDMSGQGGLHVIMTYVPHNLRIERQAFGRAARKGQRGSGQFVVMATESLAQQKERYFQDLDDIELLEKYQFDRDNLEKKRLDDLNQMEMRRTFFEEELLERMGDAMLPIIASLDSKDPEIKRLATENILIDWAFWLDRQSKAIKELKTPEDEADIQARLGAHIQILQGKGTDPKVHICDPLLLAQAGKHCESLDTVAESALAMGYFDQAIRSDSQFAEVAYYYKAASILNQSRDRKKTPDDIKQARRSFTRAEFLFQRRVTTLSNLPPVLINVAEMRRKDGRGGDTDLYSRQVEERIRIYSTHIAAIHGANGSRSIDPARLKSTGIDDATSEKILAALIADGVLVKPHRRFKVHDGAQDPLAAARFPNGYSAVAGVPEVRDIIKNFQGADSKLKLKEFMPSKDALWALLKEVGLLTNAHPVPQATGESGETIASEVAQIHMDEALYAALLATPEFVKKSFDIDGLKDVLTNPKICFADLPDMPDKQAFWDFLKENGVISEYVSEATRGNPEPEITARLNAEKLKELEADITAQSEPGAAFLKYPPLNLADLRMLSADQCVDEFCGLLVQEGVLHPPHIRRDAVVDKTHVNDVLRALAISDADMTTLAKTLEDLVKAANGEIRTRSQKEGADGYVKARLEDPTLDLADDLTFSMTEELALMRLTGLDQVIKVENQPHWWGPLVVALMGIVQIMAGAVISALGCPHIGNALISEGVGDIQFAIESAIKGDFSWSKYLEHKLISMACSIVTCGVGAYLNRGVSVAKQGIKSALSSKAVLGKIFKKCMEAVGNTLVSMGVDKMMDLAFDQLLAQLFAQITTSAGTTMARLKTKLTALHTALGHDHERVRAVMAEIDRDYLSQQKLDAEISKHVKGVANAVAGGIGRAAKGARTHGAAFQKLATGAKVANKLIDATFILKEVTMALSEIDRFVGQACDMVDEKTKEAKRGTSAASATGDTAYIDAKITAWQKQLSDEVKSKVRHGVVQPKVVAAAQRLVQRYAVAAKDQLVSAFGAENFVDHTREASLKKARETNLTRLANSQKMFKNATQTASLPEILKNNEVSFDASSLDPNKPILDGYTAAMLKGMIPEMMIVKQGDSYVPVPPGRFSEPTNVEAVRAILPMSHAAFDRDRDRDIAVCLGDESAAGHIAPKVDGNVVVLKGVDGKSLCHDQTYLFLDFYHSDEAKAMAPDARMAQAKAHAENESNIYAFRKKSVMGQFALLSQDPAYLERVRRCVNRVGSVQGKEDAAEFLKNVIKASPTTYDRARDQTDDFSSSPVDHSVHSSLEDCARALRDMGYKELKVFEKGDVLMYTIRTKTQDQAQQFLNAGNSKDPISNLGEWSSVPGEGFRFTLYDNDEKVVKMLSERSEAGIPVSHVNSAYFGKSKAFRIDSAHNGPGHSDATGLGAVHGVSEHLHFYTEAGVPHTLVYDGVTEFEKLKTKQAAAAKSKTGKKR